MSVVPSPPSIRLSPSLSLPFSFCVFLVSSAHPSALIGVHLCLRLRKEWRRLIPEEFHVGVLVLEAVVRVADPRLDGEDVCEEGSLLHVWGKSLGGEGAMGENQDMLQPHYSQPASSLGSVAGLFTPRGP